MLEVKIPLFDDFEVDGHIDGLVEIPNGFTLLPNVKPGIYVNEDKSMSQGYYWKFIKGGYQQAFPYYFDQIQGYLHSYYSGLSSIFDEKGNPTVELYRTLEEHTIDGTPYTDSGLIVAKNKETGALASEIILADDGYMIGLRRRWKLADDSVSQGELPERLYEEPDFECSECPWRKQCWAEIEPVVEETKEIVPLDPEVEVAADVYTVGKHLAVVADNMMEYGKSYLSSNTLGKTKIGKVSMNTYEVTRTIWNGKELERMLTPQQLDQVRVKKSSLTTRRDVEKMTPEQIMDLLGGVKKEQFLLGSGAKEE